CARRQDYYGSGYDYW
nr:immunoglobulin heavy chain junction region [Macaca mulatta]MOV49014.1 immunoglobulin heavy chain junction region [Macaca mulatta]MOV49761.1 immunoglobulin heavy chain junction region [Macaca mulatta]MOV52099.1 immunoglobulin heavy chain junction region [Macaca mulatta]MOV52110.1 immunoglobulin heavy chain junction region [Macaca mulatta]